jgi:hypothetical protein
MERTIQIVLSAQFCYVCVIGDCVLIVLTVPLGLALFRLLNCICYLIIICICMYVCMCVFARACVRVYVCVYVCMYVCMYMCVRVCNICRF